MLAVIVVATFSVTPAIKEEPQKKPITASKQCRGDEKVAPTHAETAPKLTGNCRGDFFSHPDNKGESQKETQNSKQCRGDEKVAPTRAKIAGLGTFDEVF